MDTIGRGAAVLLAIVLVLLFPIRYDAIKQQKSSELWIQNETKHLLYEMLQTRQLSLAVYEEYCNAIYDTQTLYQIRISCYRNSEQLLGEQVVSFHQYQDVLEELKSNKVFYFQESDYVTIHLTRNETFTQKLMNLFIPTFPTTDNIQTGGSVV